MTESPEDFLRRWLCRDKAIPLDHFLAFCASHYYATANPFPARDQAGDFTTAPETSQVFGELLGLWLVNAWQKANRPRPFILSEAGGGTGTLFADLWRAVATLDTDFCDTAEVHLVEASKALQQKQEARLASLPSFSATRKTTWHADLGTLPRGALFFIANEFLDALPVRQYILREDKWHERGITLNEDKLAFCLMPARPPLPEIPPAAQKTNEPLVIELAPARESAIALVAQQIATHGGAALFIDYGYVRPRGRSTLSAIRAHQPAEILQNLGRTDLSTHVDFATCMRVAEQAGVATELLNQREFLTRHGLEERAKALPEPQANAARSLIKQDEKQNGLGDFWVLALFPTQANATR